MVLLKFILKKKCLISHTHEYNTLPLYLLYTVDSELNDLKKKTLFV